jgi:hypothetical protein
MILDVLDWHAISPEFRKIIEQGYEIIYPIADHGE